MDWATYCLPESAAVPVLHSSEVNAWMEEAVALPWEIYCLPESAALSVFAFVAFNNIHEAVAHATATNSIAYAVTNNATAAKIRNGIANAWSWYATADDGWWYDRDDVWNGHATASNERHCCKWCSIRFITLINLWFKDICRFHSEGLLQSRNVVGNRS